MNQNINQRYNHSPFNQAGTTGHAYDDEPRSQMTPYSNSKPARPRTTRGFPPERFHIRNRPNSNCAVQAPRESLEPCPRSTPLYNADGFPDAFGLACCRSRAGVPFRERVLVSWNAAGHAGSRIVRGVETHYEYSTGGEVAGMAAFEIHYSSPRRHRLLRFPPGGGGG